MVYCVPSKKERKPDKWRIKEVVGLKKLYTVDEQHLKLEIKSRKT